MSLTRDDVTGSPAPLDSIVQQAGRLLRLGISSGGILYTFVSVCIGYVHKNWSHVRIDHIFVCVCPFLNGRDVFFNHKGGEKKKMPFCVATIGQHMGRPCTKGGERAS
jgi:CRISPR/Cas system-associated endonuclease/helicase Cas3